MRANARDDRVRLDGHSARIVGSGTATSSSPRAVGDPGGAPAPGSATSLDRALLRSSAAVASLAVLARLYNVVAYPAIRDWDASGHAVNVLDFLELHWPNPRSWCGSHPPLYHVLGALLWAIMPEPVPVHVMLRLISVAAWIATVGLVWRWLRRVGDTGDASVVAALLLGVPGFTIASCMMTNDALCALFVTATLVRLLETPPDERPSPGRAALTGVLAGLAAMSKATGMAAPGIAVAFYAWRTRRDPKRGWPALLAVAAASAAVAAPYYLHLFVSLSGSPYAILAVRAGSQEKEAIATVIDALSRTTARLPFSSLLHAAVWGDPTAVFLPNGLETHPLARAVSLAGVVVTGVAAAGVLRLLVRRGTLRRAAVALVFGVLYAAALVPHAMDRPYIVLTKINYLLPEALPCGIVLVLGMDWLRGGWRPLLRVALLVVAVGGVVLTTYGWWERGGPSSSRPIVSREVDARPAVVAVDRYFQYRAVDPVRALRLMAPQAQLGHDLRLVRILGLPPLSPETGFTAEADRSLELARARVAWLELYNLVRWVQPIAAGLTIDVLSVDEEGDGATVNVRVAPAGTTAPRGAEVGAWPFPSFGQRFTLERYDGEWRITRIEQGDAADENAVQAFVARPTMAAFEHLRALGWQPPWEAALATVVPRAR